MSGARHGAVRAALIVLFVAAAIIWCSQAIRKAERQYGNDLTGYLAASRALYAGADPYHLPDRFPYIYPLFLAAVIRPLASVPTPVATVLWFALQSACLWYVIRRAGTHARVADADRVVVAAAIVAVFGDVLQNEFLNGQVNIIVLALAVAAVHLAERRPRVAAALLAVAVAVKLTPALFLLYWLVERRYRLVVESVAWASVLIASPWLVVQNRLWPMYSGYLQEFIFARVSSPDLHARAIFFTFHGFWGWLKGSPAGGAVILSASLLVIIALVVWHHRSRRPCASSVYAAGIPLLSPMSEVHHLTFLIPAALVSAAALRDHVVLAGTALFVVLIWLGRFQRTGPWYFVAVLCVIASACAALQRKPEASH
jgi:hypothetical protein